MGSENSLAAALMVAEKIASSAPFGLIISSIELTHGLRRGLHSFAATRLVLQGLNAALKAPLFHGSFSQSLFPPCRKERDEGGATAVFLIYLGFLGGAEENLAHKGLRGLRYEHGYGVGDVIGLEHLVWVFAFMRAEFGFG